MAKQRRRFARRRRAPKMVNSFTLVLMGALLVGIVFAGDDFANKMAFVMTAKPEQEPQGMEALPPTLEAGGEPAGAGEEAGYEPAGSSSSAGGPAFEIVTDIDLDAPPEHPGRLIQQQMHRGYIEGREVIIRSHQRDSTAE